MRLTADQNITLARARADVSGNDLWTRNGGAIAGSCNTDFALPSFGRDICHQVRSAQSGDMRGAAHDMIASATARGEHTPEAFAQAQLVM